MSKKLFAFFLIGCFLLTTLQASAQNKGPSEAELQQKVADNPKSAKAYYDLGLYYYKRAKDNEALSNWKIALTLNPKNAAEIHGKMAMSYRFLKQYDKAMEHIKIAVGMAPTVADYHNTLGVLYYETQKDDQALESYKKALMFDASKPIYHNNLGKVYTSLKQYDKATAAFQKAVTIDPKDSKSYYQLGYVEQVQKNYNKAITYYQTALVHNPKYYDAHYDAGISHYSLKKYIDAEKSFREALKINSNPSKRLHFWLGVSLIYQTGSDKVKQGIEYLKQQITFKPDDTYAYHHLGFAYWKLGGEENFKQAISAFLKIMKDKYNDPDVNYYLGSSYLGAKNYTMASDYLQKAVSLDAKFYAALAELGYAYAKSNKPVDAMNAYKKALAVAPKTMVTLAEKFNTLDMLYYRIALLHFDQKRYTDCITNVDKAISLFQKDHNFFTTKGACLYQSGKVDAALVEYKKSIAMKPDDSIVHYNLALVYLKKNDKLSAQKHYDYLLQQGSTSHVEKLKPQMDKAPSQSF